MVNIRGTFKLAATKLRTRKLRLVLTAGTASLLFSALFFMAPLAYGAFSSIERFGREGLGKRYVVQASLPAQGAAVNRDEISERALQLYTEAVIKKKAAAKKLGIEYDPATDPSPITEFDTPTGKMRNLNIQNPIAKAAIKEYLAQHPLVGLPELQMAAAGYHPAKLYESKQFQNGYNDGQIQTLKDGKESFASNQTATQDPLDAFLISWTSIEDSLLQPFVLPGQSLSAAPDGSIPLVIPFSAAESLLQVKPLPNAASSDETIKHVQDVRAKAVGIHFSVCYRNQASADLLTSALNTQREAERNKNNPDYQKPALMYGLPKDTCSPVPAVQDARTASEKSLDEKKAQLAQTFGAASPTQQKLNFTVVGLSPDKKGGNASNISQIVGSVVNSSLGYGWYMPSSIEKQNPLIAQLFTADAYTIGLGHNYYAEFASPADARNFINQKGCSVDSAMRSENDSCAKSGKLFSLAAFGSSALGLDSLKQQFYQLFNWLLMAVAIVACLIMSNMAGRLIVDSRRETAVFRSIGAKRTDIAAIYLVYVTLLSLMVAVTAFAIGTTASFIAASFLAPAATAQAVVLYNTQDATMAFNLFEIHWLSVAQIGLLIVVTGYASAIVPLVRNMRRNPIQDMRNDA